MCVLTILITNTLSDYFNFNKMIKVAPLDQYSVPEKSLSRASPDNTEEI